MIGTTTLLILGLMIMSASLIKCVSAFTIIDQSSFSSSRISAKAKFASLGKNKVFTTINPRRRKSFSLSATINNDFNEEEEEDEDDVDTTMPPTIDGFDLGYSDEDTLKTLTMNKDEVLQSMTVSQLKQQLRLRGKKVTGNKAQLVERLIRPVDSNLIIQIAPATTVRYTSTTTPAKPQCSRPGCTASVHSRGLCYRHRYPCAIQGCEKGALRVGGYCIAHTKEHAPDAYEEYASDRSCKIEGCKKYARVGGYCTVCAKDHDPDAYNRLRSDQSCVLEGCTKHAQVGGYCREHAQQYAPDAYEEYRSSRSCAIDDCDKHAIAGGYCVEHAKDHDSDAYNRLRSDQSCILEGCMKQAKAGGYCPEHARKYVPTAYNQFTSSTSCKIEGCTKQAKAGGYCKEHAKDHDPTAYNRLRSRDKRCAIDDCNKHAAMGGFCIGHAKEHNPSAYNEYRSSHSCQIEGCRKQAKAGAYCSEHAQQYDPDAYEEYRSSISCAIDDCDKHAQAGRYCSEHAQQYAPVEYRDYRNRINRTQRDRYTNDPDFKLTINLRNSNRVKGKLEYLGCPVHQFRRYFKQNHFQEEGKEWMSWDNNGGGRSTVNQSWEIDHVMPVSSFVLTDPEQRKRCFHWSNMQPLKWQDNAHKYCTVPKDFEWCSEKERWLWGEASGKINYKLPPMEDDDFNGGDDKE